MIHQPGSATHGPSERKSTAPVGPTITTDTGYEGRGVRTVVINRNVRKLTNNDIVSHPDGRTFLAHGVMVVT